jgi:hypothetical protein
MNTMSMEHQKCVLKLMYLVLKIIIYCFQTTIESYEDENIDENKRTL